MKITRLLGTLGVGGLGTFVRPPYAYIFIVWHVSVLQLGATRVGSKLFKWRVLELMVFVRRLVLVFVRRLVFLLTLVLLPRHDFLGFGGKR